MAKVNNTPLSRNPEIVGTTETWVKYDAEGNVAPESLDEYGMPCAYDPYWTGEEDKDGKNVGRGTACGHQVELCDDFTETKHACIGGSDAAVVAGITAEHLLGVPTPWANPTSLYHRIRGDEPEHKKEKKENDVFINGHECEDQVARMGYNGFIKTQLEEWGLVGYMINDTNMYRSGERKEDGSLRYPNLIADCDRLLVCYPLGTTVKLYEKGWLEKNPPVKKFIIECKHSERYSNFCRDYLENELGCPERYMVQMYHYMGIIGADGAFIVAACTGSNFTRANTYVRFYERNEELCRRILDTAQKFVEDSLNGIVPLGLPYSPDSTDYIKVRPGVLEVDEGSSEALILQEIAKKKAEYEATEKRAKAQKAEYEALAYEHIVPLLEVNEKDTAEVITHNESGEKVRYALQIWRKPTTIFDAEKVYAEHPEATEIKVLSQTALKNKDKALAKWVAENCVKDISLGGLNLKVISK